MRNVDGSFNKEGPIENTVEVNIYYQGHRERTEIDVIRGQKWKVILGMLWLARHNPEIDWRTGEVKTTRYSEEYGKQWRLRMEKAKRRREEMRREGTEEERKEKTKKEKNNGNEEGNRRIGDLE